MLEIKLSSLLNEATVNIVKWHYVLNERRKVLVLVETWFPEINKRLNFVTFRPLASRWNCFRRQSCVRFRSIYARYLSSDYSWRLTKPKSRSIRGSDLDHLMSLNNSRGFPSILLVNFSILYTAGKTKLSKNGKKKMRFFVILSQSTKKWSSVSGFST